MNLSWLIILTTNVPALLLLAWALGLMQRARRSTDWPRMPATIVESRVLKQGNTRSPRLAFDYAGPAQRHVGHRLWVAPRSLSMSGGWADRVIARYPVGTTVSVAMDPANPDYAVLEPGVQTLHRLLVAAGVVVIAAGLFAAAMTH